MKGDTGRGAAAAVVLGAALLAGCSEAADGWLSDDYEMGYDEGYSDGYDDAEPGLGEVIVGGVITGIFHDDDGGGGGGDGDGPHWKSARSDLVRDFDSADPDDRGAVRVRSSRRREEFAVEVAGVEPGRTLEVFVLDRVGTEVPAGTALADYRGRASLRLRSGGWDALPAGAASLQVLEGAPLVLRDGAGRAVLRGRVPSVRGMGTRWAAARAEDGETGVGARIRLLGSAAAGRRMARVDLSGLPAGTAADLLVGDADGVLRPAGRVVAGVEGGCRFLFDSRRGDPLPGRADELADLAGREFEIRIDGDTVLAADFPAF